MIQKVITGGQAGVERLAWASARRAGIATGGYMPAGFAAEDGPQPRLAALFGAIEFRMDDARRLRANLRHADGVLLFGDTDSPHARATLAACHELGKPFLAVQPALMPAPQIVSWLVVFEVKTLMVAGPPASADPGLPARAAALLDRVFAARRTAMT
ncbi:YpsA SLOG family protein [Tundrisphaera sp. TA3]|uniref:YpsA SLOG family protein n=1 Tax=Tundrisphaera sp. TA3 TaxID=3435775 RepID=UPI003EC090A4